MLAKLRGIIGHLQVSSEHVNVPVALPHSLRTGFAHRIPPFAPKRLGCYSGVLWANTEAPVNHDLMRSQRKHREMTVQLKRLVVGHDSIARKHNDMNVQLNHRLV
jgi:hypothetical protein